MGVEFEVGKLTIKCDSLKEQVNALIQMNNKMQFEIEKLTARITELENEQ